MLVSSLNPKEGDNRKPSENVNPYSDPKSQKEAQLEEMKDEKAKNAEALSEWMFISIDKEGKVMLNTIQKTIFVLKANKYPIIQHEENTEESKFRTVCCRFRN